MRKGEPQGLTPGDGCSGQNRRTGGSLGGDSRFQSKTAAGGNAMYLSNTRGYPLRWPILDHSPHWTNRSIPKIDPLAAATLSLSQPAGCLPGHARQCVNGHSKDIMDRIRLLLLVDYVLVRESLSRQLRLESDFEIVADCGTAAEGLEALSRSLVDVVLLDSEAVGDQAAQFISTARQAGYQRRFLVLASEKIPPACSCPYAPAPPAYSGSTARWIVSRERSGKSRREKPGSTWQSSNFWPAPLRNARIGTCTAC